MANIHIWLLGYKYKFSGYGYLVLEICTYGDMKIDTYANWYSISFVVIAFKCSIYKKNSFGLNKIPISLVWKSTLGGVFDHMEWLCAQKH